jgi:DNA-binding MarR family transcriptional regulator
MRKIDPAHQAREFGALFPAVYLRFHRRDGKRRELPSASGAVLHHLMMSGPLAVGELARHLDRAQSVVSEIVLHLERDGFLERQRDATDRRRSLVWLSERGLALLEQQREVLSGELLVRAFSRMTPADGAALLQGMRALITANGASAPNTSSPSRAPAPDATPVTTQRRRKS